MTEEVKRGQPGGGRDSVYDVLGELFEGKPLRELLMEARLYGDDPKHKQKLFTAVDGVVDKQKIETLIRERKLTSEGLDPRTVTEIREKMERAAARRPRLYRHRLPPSPGAGGHRRHAAIAGGSNCPSRMASMRRPQLSVRCHQQRTCIFVASYVVSRQLSLRLLERQCACTSMASAFEATGI